MSFQTVFLLGVKSVTDIKHRRSCDIIFILTEYYAACIRVLLYENWGISDSFLSLNGNPDYKKPSNL